MMVFGDVTGGASDFDNYDSVEAGEIVCSSAGLFSDRTTAFRTIESDNGNKDECFMIKYPIGLTNIYPLGTETLNFCIFCGATDQGFPFST